MVQTLKSDKAKVLRRIGLSIGEISKKLKTSKSTVSYWCRDIALTKKQLHEISLRQKSKSLKALNIYVEKLRSDRLSRVKKHQQEGTKMVGNIKKRDLFILGLGLYWAEGYKKGNSELGFTNSDQAIIKIIIRWFIEIYGIHRKDFILRVSINNIHAGRIGEIIKYWSKITKVPPSQFTKTSLIKVINKKVYLNQDKYFGTLRIKVRRGYALRCQILGSLTALI